MRTKCILLLKGKGISTFHKKQRKPKSLNRVGNFKKQYYEHL